MQGVFVSDHEIAQVVEHWKDQIDDPNYDLSIIETGDDGAARRLDGDDEQADRLLSDAIEVIREYDRASATLLQRRLKGGLCKSCSSDRPARSAWVCRCFRRIQCEASASPRLTSWARPSRTLHERLAHPPQRWTRSTGGESLVSPIPGRFSSGSASGTAWMAAFSTRRRDALRLRSSGLGPPVEFDRRLCGNRHLDPSAGCQMLAHASVHPSVRLLALVPELVAIGTATQVQSLADIRARAVAAREPIAVQAWFGRQ